MSDFRKLKNSELDRLGVEQFKSAAKTPIIVILDNIRSLNNVGSVFRTSDAFRIEKIYLCGITATPPHKDIQKTALGSTESVAWEYVEDCTALVSDLNQQGVLENQREVRKKGGMRETRTNSIRKVYDEIFKKH